MIDVTSAVSAPMPWQHIWAGRFFSAALVCIALYFVLWLLWPHSTEDDADA